MVFAIYCKSCILALAIISFISVFVTTAAPKRNLSYLDENAPIFVPSHEWQIVRDGQAIPPGLHIRSNLRTGKTEAKLMDNDPNDKSHHGAKSHDNDNNLPVLVEQPDANLKMAEMNLNREEVLKAMKKLTEHGEKEHDENYEKTLKDKVKKEKYRSYESLKKDFEKMHVNVRSDAENIQELLSHLKNASDTKLSELVQIRLLTDLEYYLHQIDNAQHFCDIGGIRWLVESLNVSDIVLTLKSQYLYALSAAVHGNSKVQICALQSDILTTLNHLLQITLAEDKNKLSHTSEEISFYSRILGVLGGVLQLFPTAQYHWVQSASGLSTLATLHDTLDQWKANNQHNNKLLKQIISLQMKILTLLADLQEERNAIHHQLGQLTNSATEMTNLQEKLRQYNLGNYEEHLIRSGWCERLQHACLRLSTESSHDLREKTLEALEELGPAVCVKGVIGMTDAPIWHSNQLLEVLRQLQKEYEHLAEVESHEESGGSSSSSSSSSNATGGYFHDILALIYRVKHLISVHSDL